jgi:hypothetical protein
MELLWFFAGMAALAVTPVVLGLLLGRTARLRRRLRQHPILSIAAARDDRIVRVRGVVRCDAAAMKLPFTGREAVFHHTQVTDTANPGETGVFTRCESVGFVLDDGTGRARIPQGVMLEVLGEPALGGAGRNEPALAEFMGKAIDRLFSKGGWVAWSQTAIHIGDEVIAFGRMAAERALAPAEAGGSIIIEIKTPTRAG